MHRLRAFAANARHHLSARGRQMVRRLLGRPVLPDSPQLIPAYDPTMPTGIASYQPNRSHRAKLRGHRDE